MKRTLIGWLAAGLLASGILLWLSGATEHSPGLVGGLVRMGIVTLAIWLAMPPIEALIAKTPKWFGWAVGGVILIVAIIPSSQILVLILPVLGLAATYRAWIPMVWSLVTSKRSTSVSKSRAAAKKTTATASPSETAPPSKTEPPSESRVVEGSARPAPKPPTTAPAAASTAQATGPKRRPRPPR